MDGSQVPRSRTQCISHKNWSHIYLHSSPTYRDQGDFTAVLKKVFLPGQDNPKHCSLRCFPKKVSRQWWRRRGMLPRSRESVVGWWPNHSHTAVHLTPPHLRPTFHRSKANTNLLQTWQSPSRNSAKQSADQSDPALMSDNRYPPRFTRDLLPIWGKWREKCVCGKFQNKWQHKVILRQQLVKPAKPETTKTVRHYNFCYYSHCCRSFCPFFKTNRYFCAEKSQNGDPSFCVIFLKHTWRQV